MKTRIILSILLVTVFFTGCKNDKSIDSLEVVKPEVVDNSFKVILKVIVKKDGSKIIIPQLTYIAKKNVDLTPTDLAGYEKQNINIKKAEEKYKEAQERATQNGTGI